MIRARIRFSSLAVAIVLCAHPAAGQSAQFKNWNASALADAVQSKPRAACASLGSLTGYELTIIEARVVPAAQNVPEHCRVLGQIQPEVRFEVLLPAVWNGHLYMFGNGGYAGEPLEAPGRVAIGRRALALGFAVTQTNTGHDAAAEPLGTFAVNSQKFLDYAFRAVHVTALTAKRILQAYYDSALHHSYFDGCSTGGRQGLISAQRFPEDFDGILNGAPVLDFSGTMIGYNTYQRALQAAPIAAAKLDVLAKAIYAKCDATDGVTDQLVGDPRRCAFKPDADLPKCAGDADAPGCFTTAQIKALDVVYSGVKRNGVEIFPGWAPGAEVAAPGPGGASASGWVPWFVAGGPAPSPVQVNFGQTFMRYMAFGRANPNYDWMTFDLDADYDKLQSARTILDATNPDLSRFKARGGKIVSYFGWADPALNPNMGVKYYESVAKALGSMPTDFYRLFMVPGMFHCGGGVGVNNFDAFTPLVEWVERGKAPPSIAGARVVDGKELRTRPLCPYPEVARYKGSGSVDEASNFSCQR